MRKPSPCVSPSVGPVVVWSHSGTNRSSRLCVAREIMDRTRASTVLSTAPPAATEAGRWSLG